MMKYVDLSAIVLYALLGFALSAAGVGVMVNTGWFLAILFLVVLIDINSARLIMKSYYE